MEGVGVACGKVILLGEHAVVYGHPALAAGLSLPLVVSCRARPAVGGGLITLHAPDLGLSVSTPWPAPTPPSLPVLACVAACLDEAAAPPADYHLVVQSQIPVGKGMGSSAALAVACLRAIAGATGRGVGEGLELAARANRVEGIFHGTPSGVDAAVVSLGGVMAFRRGPPLAIEPLALARPLPVILLDSGQVGETWTQVAAVRDRREADPLGVDLLFEAIAALTQAGRAAAEAGDLATLGRLMDQNHRCLQVLGVSTPALDGLVDLARGAGALGAKLTGAGGGGLVLGLMPDEGAAAALERRARARGIEAWAALLGAPVGGGAP